MKLGSESYTVDAKILRSKNLGGHVTQEYTSYLCQSDALCMKGKNSLFWIHAKVVIGWVSEEMGELGREEPDRLPPQQSKTS